MRTKHGGRDFYRIPVVTSVAILLASVLFYSVYSRNQKDRDAQSPDNVMVVLVSQDRGEILQTLVESMSLNPIYPDPKQDSTLLYALKDHIDQWQLSDDQQSREREIERNCLFLKTQTFFYQSFNSKRLLIPKHEESVVPASRTIEDLMKNEWPELDAGLREEFVEDFSNSRDKLRLDVLVPDGKARLDGLELGEFRTRMESIILKYREEARTTGIETENRTWREIPVLVGLGAEAAREWHRATSLKDVVVMDGSIAEEMEKSGRLLKELERSIAELHKTSGFQ
jgi:hypothetical protein